MTKAELVEALKEVPDEALMCLWLPGEEVCAIALAVHIDDLGQHVCLLTETKNSKAAIGAALAYARAIGIAGNWSE
jgi:hypothetical protein